MSWNTRTGEHRPSVRRLRVFAVDPSLGLERGTAGISEIALEVPWEVRTRGSRKKPWPEPGPRGEYLEVIDHDPASGCFYAPVDLNHPYLLAQDGLPPSEDDPQFHQQMVYAVAMTTVEFFERALGRVALWAPRKRFVDGKYQEEFVRQLRLYPHALREANAYYHPGKKAILFGYFPTRERAGSGQMVFTALSQDIIAHETTHALLDGIHPRFAEGTNPDVLALHEAFADIVAILQRFSSAELLRHQIARARGDLSSRGLLSQLARQVGESLGRRGALRDFLGEVDPETRQWVPHEPDPGAFAAASEPHARGAILVAALFDAFLSIYHSRVSDLFRVAGVEETGPDSSPLHPDLVERLAKEAARSAHHLLRMCIRALDQCPPVDVTFSDYLRALVTADYDLYPDDPDHYRVAIIEAFRRRGIYAHGVRGMSESSLLWPSGREVISNVTPARQRQGISALFRSSAKGRGISSKLWYGWDLDIDREDAWKRARHNAALLHRWLTKEGGKKFLPAFGIVLDPQGRHSVFTGKDGQASVEVHSVRTAMRRGSRDNLTTELVVEITQRRRGYFDAEEQAAVDAGTVSARGRGDFRFRRGCTVLIDPRKLEVRRIIRTRGDILDDVELDRVRRFLSGADPSPPNAFHGRSLHDGDAFARLHQGRH